MDIYTATEVAYNNGCKATEKKYKKIINELQGELAKAKSDMKWLISHNKDVCKLCAYRFGDDPTNCLECDDSEPYENFKWTMNNDVSYGNT